MLKRSIFGIFVFILIFSMSTSVMAVHYPFTTSDSNATSRLNTFWNIYGVSEGAADANGYTGAVARNTAWLEWDMLKTCWTSHSGLRDSVKNWLVNSTTVNGVNGATGAMPTGYVWSWGGNVEHWPDETGSGHGGVGSYHYDQIPAYICAIYDYYIWTRDSSFLSTMLPRAEVVMDSYFLNTMQGSNNVITIPDAANNGTSASRPSTYMDQIRSGYKDAYINSIFFTALDNMADLEELAGNTSKSTTYRNLCNQFSARFDTAFWNSSTLRYAGWRDVNGTLHDAGYTWTNLEALSRGLGNVDKAHRIFDWLKNPSQATIAGAHTGSTDPYQYVGTVRANTSGVPAADWDSWSGTQTLKPYGSLIENGGTALWFAYYDIMARLRYSTADDAWDKNWKLLDRMARDSKFLSYSSGRSYNDFNEDFVEIGTNQPFPESGISGLPILIGFMGVNAKKDGLNIKPNLPNDLVSAQATDINYKGSDKTISVSRGTTIAEQANSNAAEQLHTGDVLTQSFNPSSSFNEIGAYVGTYNTQTSAFNLDLQKYVNGTWKIVGSRRFTNVKDNTWVHLALPTQAAGAEYRVHMYSVSGSIAWWRNSSSSFSGTSYHNGTVLAGDFMIRVMNTPLTSVVDLSGSSTCDSNSLQQQTFSTTVPFDRIGVSVGTWVTTSSGCTMRLLRDVGGRWQIVSEQVFRDVPDNSTITLSMSEQPAGNYLLEMRDRTGSIGWYRDANSTYANGYALNDGTQVSGDRKFSIFRGKYTITVQPDNITTTIDAGNTYVLP